MVFNADALLLGGPLEFMKRHIIAALSVVCFLSIRSSYSAEFLHPSDVVKEMQQKFKSLKSYSASFSLDIKENAKSRTSRGKVYYQSGGKLHFAFSSPAGDKIVSDGKKMWVYVERLRAVGVQDLKYKKDGKSIYDTNSYEGLVRLFQRYHYRFDDVEQPRDVGGKKYFVLELKEKVSSGGYEKLLLYVSPETYNIEKLSAWSASGRTVDLKFSDITPNDTIPGDYFQFKVTDNMKVVENPLTTE